MAELFHKTFATDLSEFVATTASNGTIAQSSGAGLNGTTGGVLCTINGGAVCTARGKMTTVLSGLAAMRFAFFLDFDGITISADGNWMIIWDCNPTSDAASVMTNLRMNRVSGALIMGCRSFPDAGVATEQAVSLSSIPAWIEVEVLRETTDGTNDGEMRFYFGGRDYPSGGTQVAEFLSVQNYVGFNSVTRSRIGDLQSQSGVSGTLKVDEIIFRDDNTPILYGIDVATSGRPYDLDQLTDLTTIRM